MSLFFGLRHHRREACQALGHAAHLACDVHVPHLIAVAGTSTPFSLISIGLDVRTVMQAVPYPESHVLGNQKSLLGDGFVIDVVGNVDETGQLLVYAVIGCPHPLLVVVGAVHLDEHTMLGGDGIDITVTVVGIILLVAVEVGPRAFQLAQLVFRGEVTCLAVTAQSLVIDEGALLTLT